jgi:hypothetical protein
MKIYLSKVFTLVLFLFNFSFAQSNNYTLGFIRTWQTDDYSSQPPDKLWDQMDTLNCNYAHFSHYTNEVSLQTLLNNGRG